MCLVRFLNAWFFDNAMDELLLQKMVVCSCQFCERSFKILFIQTAWHVAPIVATYSPSVEDRVTMYCFFKIHDTTPIPKLNDYLDVLFLSYVFPPLSMLLYPMRLKLSQVEYIIQISFVPLTYLRIILPTFHESLLVTPRILRSELRHT